MESRLTIIVPTLNEESALRVLLDDLAGQRGLDFSLILADGGSVDATLALFDDLAPSLPFPATQIRAPRGRGSQMNAGAAFAEEGDLLFLHADSRIPEPEFLAKAASLIDAARAASGDNRVAGHFALRFCDGGDFFHHFYEAKTATGREGTINGDQGLWLSREFFYELGGFDETFPFMEDARIEGKIRSKGLFVLLPGRLGTSVRRFKAEGRAARQLLNALLRAFDHLKVTCFFDAAQKLYVEQSQTGRLTLLPYLSAAHEALWRGGVRRGLALFYRAGSFARGNFWQLPFALDSLFARAKGAPSGEVRARLTAMAERPYEFLTDNPPGRALAALLTFGAFYVFMASCKLLSPAKRER